MLTSSQLTYRFRYILGVEPSAFRDDVLRISLKDGSSDVDGLCLDSPARLDGGGATRRQGPAAEGTDPARGNGRVAVLDLHVIEWDPQLIRR